ncbi:MAG: hypothetical protein L3I99_01935 [Sulfurimonas sp.]|nr:hypothetical protein [Sulfurimonas sp.]
MKFFIYDFGFSSYSNSKSNIQSNLIFATGKAWVWKKYLPQVAVANTHPIDPPTGGHQYMKTKEVKQIIYPNTDWVYNTDITDIPLFNTVPQHNMSGIGSNVHPNNMLSSTEMISFIKKYKVNKNASGIRNGDGEWMSLVQARNAIQILKDEFVGDPSSYATFNYSPYLYINNISKYKKVNTINFYRNNQYDIYRTDISSSRASVRIYGNMTSASNTEIMNSVLLLPANATITKWHSKFSASTITERDRYASLEYIVNKVSTHLRTTYFVHDYFDYVMKYNAMLVKIPYSILIEIIDSSLAEYDALIATTADLSWEAKDEPLGMILSRFNALDDVVSMDLDNVDSVMLSFRISVNRDTNKLEDEQKKTRLQVIEDLEYEVPEWRDYCFIRYEETEDPMDPLGPTIPREYLYILDWNKVRNLNNYKFMVLLQAFMILDVGAPNKSYSLWDYVKLVVLIVVSYFSAGLGFVFYMSAAGATIMAIGMYTNNNSLIKFGNMLMTLSSIVSVANGYMLSDLGTSDIISYALKISTMAFSEFRKIEAKRYSQKFNELKDEIDGVSEIVTPLDKMKKVQRFIHSEDLKSPNEISYDEIYMTPYDKHYKI